MIRRKISSFISDYYKNNRNALLITGAHQIGQTFSIREFGRSFKAFVEINFIDNPEAIAIFKEARNSNDIYSLYICNELGKLNPKTLLEKKEALCLSSSCM